MAQRLSGNIGFSMNGLNPEDKALLAAAVEAGLYHATVAKDIGIVSVNVFALQAPASETYMPICYNTSRDAWEFAD